MKKVLAWAVVLALVLSSFTMAFAGEGAKTSKDFKDASEIQYTEAVDVMVATGIINGFPDGTFGPKKTVQRDQMAKMIACIMNGGEDVGDQYKSTCPFADSKSSWAAGYIAYCASEHIIDGRSADVFDPTAQVTGTEVAKMALTSLGYDSKIQGYTGENWAANVLKDAKKNNLFDGLDKSFVPGDPCSREAAAQILFNMLKAVEVEYNNNTSISVGDDTQVVVSSKAEKVTPAMSGVKDDNGDKFTNLYEDVFGGELSLNKTKGDDFGNPGHSWTYPDEDTAVGTYTDSVDYEFVAEGAGFEAALKEFDEELYDQLKANPAELTVDSLLINGVEDPDKTGAAIGLGDKVKMYDVTPDDYKGEDKQYKVVVEQYKAYQIKEVNTKDISSKEAKKGVTALVTFQQKGAAVQNLTKVKNTDIAGYDESYVKDAVVAIAMKGDKILDSYVMEELVSGKVTKAYVGKNDVMIDGTKYDAATNFCAMDVKDPFEFAIDGTYTLYDYNDYALASTLVEEPAAEVFYGVVTAVGQEQQTWSDAQVSGSVKIFTAEGKTEIFKLNADYVEKDGNLSKLQQILYPVYAHRGYPLVAYTLNDEGEINGLDQATPAGWTPEAMATGGVLNGREVSEDVAAFANTGTLEKPEWVVYSFADLEAADKVTVNTYFDNDDDALVAIDCNSLEKTTTVLGILTSKTPIKNSDGTAYELTAFVNGEKKDYTTDKNVTVDDNCINDFVVLTFDGELVKTVERAKCTGVAKASADIPEGFDAAFYGTGELALSNIYKVIGISGNTINVGKAAEGETPAYNDKQACTGATVYSITFGEGATPREAATVEVSSIDNIEEGYFVILMKTKSDSSTWDTVVYAKDLTGTGLEPATSPAVPQ